MAVTQAQAPTYSFGTGTTLGITLGSTPTAGNLMLVLLASGSMTSPTIPGFTLGNYVIGGGDDVAWLYRVVVGGDGTSYTVSGNASGNDIGAVFVELAGAGSSPTITYSIGDVTWTLGTTSMPSKSLASPGAGAYSQHLYSIYTGSSSYTVGADSMNNGATWDSSHMAGSSASNKSYFGFGHQSWAGTGTSLSTFTAPNVGTATSTNDVITVMVAASATTVTLTFTDTVNALSDSLSVTANSNTVNLTFSDTIAAISDTLAVSAASPLTINLVFVDILIGISDFFKAGALGELTSGQQTFFPQAGNSGTLASQTLNTNKQTYFKPAPTGTTQAPGPQTFFPFGPPATSGSPTAPLTTPNQTIFPQEGT